MISLSHDLRVIKMKPYVGLHAGCAVRLGVSLSLPLLLPPPPTPLCMLSFCRILSSEFCFLLKMNTKAPGSQRKCSSSNPPEALHLPGALSPRAQRPAGSGTSHSAILAPFQVRQPSSLVHSITRKTLKVRTTYLKKENKRQY